MGDGFVLDQVYHHGGKYDGHTGITAISPYYGSLCLNQTLRIAEEFCCHGDLRWTIWCWSCWPVLFGYKHRNNRLIPQESSELNEINCRLSIGKT